MDRLTPQQRHANMAAIRGKDTKPEMIVRRGLWKRGFRYRLNHKRLPGHPDLVLRKYRTCMFWVNKIRRNKERDIEDQKRLAAMGWHCITVWECELKPKKREETLESLAYTLNHIYLQDHQIPQPYKALDEENGVQMAAEPII